METKAGKCRQGSQRHAKSGRQAGKGMQSQAGRQRHAKSGRPAKACKVRQAGKGRQKHAKSGRQAKAGKGRKENKLMDTTKIIILVVVRSN